MSFYSDITENTVRPLLTRFGQLGEFHKVTPGTYDTATGTVTEPLKKYKNISFLKQELDFKDQNSTKYQMANAKLTAILPVVPTTADKVVLNKIEYGIIAFTELAPGGETVFYTLYVEEV